MSFFNFRVRVENKRLVQKVTAITVVMFYKLFRPRPIVKTMFYITTEFIFLFLWVYRILKRNDPESSYMESLRFPFQGYPLRGLLYKIRMIYGGWNLFCSLQILEVRAQEC